MRNIPTARLGIVAAVVSLMLAACSTEPTATSILPLPPTVPLENIVVPNLPAPLYHFEYDSAGRVRLASFASDLTRYDVTWSAGRIGEMQNTAGNRERLQYVYDNAGRATLVKYFDANDQVYVLVSLTYDGSRLVGLERERRVTGGGFVVNKTMTFTYYPDGNLATITEHRPPVEGLQPEATSATHFEQYDTRVNVDGFSLIHDDFFDHLVLLPGVQLQKNNPAREIRTGDGVNYVAEYTYTYDALDRPTSKVGTATVTTGSNPGTFPLRSDFTYYP